MSKHTAFISFDGLSDPLGQSQIIPYVCGLASKGYAIKVFSLEKPKRLNQENERLNNILKRAGISWHYLLYDETAGWYSRYQYTRQLRKLVVRHHLQQAFNLVHCRSYLAALSGLYLKKRFGLSFVFDMRGFWADERRDGGIWNTKRPLHLLLYRYFKFQEKKLLKQADAVVSLTHAGVKELDRKFPQLLIPAKTSVIPCCTSTDLFDPAKTDDTINLPFEPGTPYLIYLGSIGTWYYTKELIDCYQVWQTKIPGLKLLIITPDLAAAQTIIESSDTSLKAGIFCKSASHRQVPGYLKHALASVFFIKPAYSKIASSPTKMAECWSMGIPVVTNSGIGDNDAFFTTQACGVLITSFSKSAYQQALDTFLSQQFNSTAIRNFAVTHFEHSIAIARYAKIYQQLLT